MGLDLSGLRGKTDSLSGLDGIALLEHLGLSQLTLSDAVLAAVARLPRLRELDLGYVRGVTGAGLGALTSATGLRGLSLTRCEAVTPVLARALVSKLDLQRLALDSRPAIDAATAATLQALRPALSLSSGG